MRHPPSRLLGFRQCPGFALRDAVTAVSVLGVLLALASVTMPRFRSAAMLEECIDNQREISAGSAAFALANQDQFVGLTWRQGNQTSQYADLRNQAAQAGNNPHAAQVVDFWRRRGLTWMPAISAWFADNLYFTTPLVELLNKDLTDPFTVCPADGPQLAWRTNPTAFNTNAFLPLQPDGLSESNRRWPYASSYLATAAAIDPYQSDPAIAPNLRMRQGENQSAFTIASSNPRGPSAMSLVTYPSAKVFFFDSADWHVAATPAYFAKDGATLPAAFFDGAVRVVQSDRATEPWFPHSPTFPGGTPYTYSPSPWNPPGFGPVVDPFRYTRDGLRGIDFPPLSRVRGAATGRTR